DEVLLTRLENIDSTVNSLEIMQRELKVLGNKGPDPLQLLGEERPLLRLEAPAPAVAAIEAPPHVQVPV
ncbi:MAG TPA: hypothetical protein VN457_04725, partial [Chlamydiales bacterium]|nr:hypothetical protein [Chlamydiales bacterium]